MCEAVVGNDLVQLRFYRSLQTLGCEVMSCAQEPRDLTCREQSLLGVLSGLRYHFAGSNVLCSIQKNADSVHFDLQLGEQLKERVTLSVDAYMHMLSLLEIRV